MASNEWGRAAANAVLKTLERKYGKGYASVLSTDVIHALYDAEIMNMILSWDDGAATLDKIDNHVRAARRHLGVL